MSSESFHQRTPTSFPKVDQATAHRQIFGKAHQAILEQTTVVFESLELKVLYFHVQSV